MITVEDIKKILQSTCPLEYVECQKCLDTYSNLDDSTILEIIKDCTTYGAAFYKLFHEYIKSLPLRPNNKTKYIEAINEWAKQLQELDIDCDSFEPILKTTKQRKEYVLKAIQEGDKSAKDLAMDLLVSERTIRSYIKEIREKYNCPVLVRKSKKVDCDGELPRKAYIMPNSLHTIDMVMTMEELLVLFKAFRNVLEIKDWPHRKRVGSLANRIWKQLDNVENDNYAQNRLEILLSQAGHRTDVLLDLMREANEKYEALNYGFDYEEYINGMETEEAWEYIGKRIDVEVMGYYTNEQGVKVSVDGCKVTLIKGTNEVCVKRPIPTGKKKRKLEYEMITVEKSKFNRIIPK